MTGVVAMALLASAAAPAPALEAPRSAAIGAPVRIAATGLRPGFFYRATLDQAPAAKKPGLACVRNIGQPFHAGRSDRTYVWRGRVPSTLRCRNTRTNQPAGVITLKPGTYRWVVGRKTGRASWDRRASLAVQQVQITRAPGRPLAKR